MTMLKSIQDGQKKQSDDIRSLKDRVQEIEECDEGNYNYDDNYDEGEENPHDDGENVEIESETPAKKQKKDDNCSKVGNKLKFGNGRGGGFYRGGRGGHRGSRGGYRGGRGGFRGGRGRGSGPVPKNSQRGGNPQKY
ncbi:uncharacterized protein LOC127723868 [Mytilus californianus]|uniref:uncharacterized protein LOC127723868 n=1 Tax=Mytilus californianus TaxID=6549 RepID=UPI002246E964|nr:uncharacterized protein LOC127723868 [Mytilus californianus]